VAIERRAEMESWPSQPRHGMRYMQVAVEAEEGYA
jgi:hypothetical protein